MVIVRLDISSAEIFACYVLQMKVKARVKGKAVPKARSAESEEQRALSAQLLCVNQHASSPSQIRWAYFRVLAASQKHIPLAIGLSGGRLIKKSPARTTY